MTKEVRIVFEPTDVISLRLRCDNCGVELVFSPATQRNIVNGHCPVCGNSRGNFERQERLLRALNDFHSDPKGESYVTVSLELDGDSL